VGLRTSEKSPLSSMGYQLGPGFKRYLRNYFDLFLIFVSIEHNG
jgi:hypothetical protein